MVFFLAAVHRSALCLRAQEPAVVYICPMDAGVRQAAPGKCPICGMALAPSTPGQFLRYVLRVETAPRAVRAGRPLALKFTLTHPKTGERIRDFARVHEKLFHLFIVGHDLETFAHVHPEQQPDGTFRLKTTLPKPGHYQLIADFFPHGGTPQTIQRALVTAGYTTDLRPAKLVPDREWVRTESGLRIELKRQPLVAGKAVLLSALVSDARSGAPATDLEQYLGAWGHMLVMSADLADAVHVHPAPETKAGGPEVVFETRFPRPGDYRVWTQFQRKGEVVTAAFTVRAEPLDAEFLKRQ